MHKPIYYFQDPQQLPPDDYCARCEAELWGKEAEPDDWGHVLCGECRRELARARLRLEEEPA